MQGYIYGICDYIGKILDYFVDVRGGHNHVKAAFLQVVLQFLLRAAGSPAPKSTSHNFTDVKAGSYYEQAVLWAVENGITVGTSSTTFSPDATCTRAQAVTFLYRAFGSPAVSDSAAFSDVTADAYYADAVAWAEKKGITTGIGDGLFGSNNDCTRAQIVTFLWRAMAE